MDIPNYSPTITVVTRTRSGSDTDGNPTYTPTTTDYRGVFAPAGSTELVQGQDVAIDQDSVYLFQAITASAIDRVIVNGVTYEVDGTPQVYDSPFTGLGYTVIRLRKVTG